MADKRLLINRVINIPIYGDKIDITAYLWTQDAKTRKLTLQEVGEWLDRELSDPHNEIEAVTRRKVSKRGGRFYTEDIKTFQRGEMPDDN